MSYGTFISGNRLYINGNTSVVTRMGDGILTTGTDGLRIIYGRSGWGGGGGPGWGGGNPGWGGGQQVSPPSWARGTFYGIAQDGTPITLTIASNGAVTANIGGSMSYGSFIRGNQLAIGGNVSNVTRLSNGIRTTLVGGGVVIDYRRR
ncbi:hypothetical protein [Leptolyngbya sp. 7M]|uniref:hypothetical protein n=1 Tax=Leptolyngbya sp. 7M TaxID=2812896 RepID=UPI001B8C1143|nr:hypothetical protein [Leptolyngbya sp. 7M]QYO62474.1 hypothetical protein JVX88_20620 [Leptolyngbya sp. 7M]